MELIKLTLDSALVGDIAKRSHIMTPIPGRLREEDRRKKEEGMKAKFIQNLLCFQWYQSFFCPLELHYWPFWQADTVMGWLLADGTGPDIPSSNSLAEGKEASTTEKSSFYKSCSFCDSHIKPRSPQGITQPALVLFSQQCRAEFHVNAILWHLP